MGFHLVEKLTDFIDTLEKALGRTAEKIFIGMQVGDVPVTIADIDTTRKNLEWKHRTTISNGIKQFTRWFLEYYALD